MPSEISYQHPRLLQRNIWPPCQPIRPIEWHAGYRRLSGHYRTVSGLFSSLLSIYSIVWGPYWVSHRTQTDVLLNNMSNCQANGKSNKAALKWSCFWHRCVKSYSFPVKLKCLKTHLATVEMITKGNYILWCSLQIESTVYSLDYLGPKTYV